MDDKKNIIICVGRQLGSGGHDIARMLAMDFNAKYYDSELLNLAAKESGFSEKFFEQNDEKKGFLRSLLSVPVTHLSGANLYKSNFSQESLFQFQSDAIRKAAEEGNCVFVGRCADYVLRDMPNVVTVFITASMRSRIDKLLAQRRCPLNRLSALFSLLRRNVLPITTIIQVRSGGLLRAMTYASTPAS
jgi:cytidylate kinase